MYGFESVLAKIGSGRNGSVGIPAEPPLRVVQAMLKLPGARIVDALNGFRSQVHAG